MALAGSAGQVGLPLRAFGGWVRLPDLRRPLALASFKDVLLVINPPCGRYTFEVERRLVCSTTPDA